MDGFLYPLFENTKSFVQEGGIKMMNKLDNYNEAVKVIKTAILKSQYEAVKSVNEKQLTLYFAIGKYISINSRKGFWGENALETISNRLQKELPGLRGFSLTHLKSMRIFYEEWSFLENNQINSLLSEKEQDDEPKQIWYSRVPNLDKFINEFMSIGFTHHRIILRKVKSIEERTFYISKCASNHLSVRQLDEIIDEDLYNSQGELPNNFSDSIQDSRYLYKAINTFKDEYLLNLVNIEDIDARDLDDVDERVLENRIVHNIKKFILTFGDGFAFIGNQYHLEAFGEDQYVDLLFFNRDLNCLVAIELKTGKFKTAYLGQLSGYLSILDKIEKKPHENPSIGIILCKDVNKSFVDYVIHDYSKPMGVATYKTSKEMSEKLKNALPNLDELRKLIDEERE